MCTAANASHRCHHSDEEVAARLSEQGVAEAVRAAELLEELAGPEEERPAVEEEQPAVACPEPEFRARSAQIFFRIFVNLRPNFEKYSLKIVCVTGFDKQSET